LGLMDDGVSRYTEMGSRDGSGHGSRPAHMPPKHRERPVGSTDSAAEDSEERFRLLVDSVRDYAIFMLSPEGLITTWNAGAERIKGYRAREIVGRPYAVLFPPDEVATGEPEKALRTAAADGRFELEGWRQRKDGSRFWGSVVLSAVIDARGELRGFAAVTRDHTERRKAEETARRLEAEIVARTTAEQAEAQLRASEERYRQQREQLAIILEGVADGITAQQPDGQILYANDAAAQACGYESAAALMQASPGEIIERFDAFDEHGQPFDWARLPGRRALAGEANATATLHIREKATGRDWWSLIRSRAILDERGTPYLVVNIWRDVTEQRRREIEAQFLADATAVLSSGLDAHAAFEQLAQLCVPRLADWCLVRVLENDELVPVAAAHADPARLAFGRSVQQRYPLDARQPLPAHAVARSGKSELYVEVSDQLLQEHARDPEHLALARALGIRSAIVVPLRARGRTLGALTLAVAESQRRYGQADLLLAEELGRRAGIALDNARLYGEATDAIRARDEFLSIAGHELKTPLAAMSLQVGGLLRLYQRGDAPNPSRAIDRLQKTASQTRRLDTLIDQLLDVSRITSGRLKLELEEVDLAELTADVVGRFADAAASAGTPIELRTGAHPIGRWDRLRIDQVLTNLLSNAVKYGPGKPVTVEVGIAEERARVSVCDHGIGIAPEHQARIFGRFERAVSGRHYGGFGLGLWITRQVVEVHGGAIELCSTPGEGSTFTVELPLGR
jgi:PAS domain S-box-containing protein